MYQANMKRNTIHNAQTSCSFDMAIRCVYCYGSKSATWIEYIHIYVQWLQCFVCVGHFVLDLCCVLKTLSTSSPSLIHRIHVFIRKTRGICVSRVWKQQTTILGVVLLQKLWALVCLHDMCCCDYCGCCCCCCCVFLFLASLNFDVCENDFSQFFGVFVLYRIDNQVQNTLWKWCVFVVLVLLSAVVWKILMLYCTCFTQN